jgi:hypothetical protein
MVWLTVIIFIFCIFFYFLYRTNSILRQDINILGEQLKKQSLLINSYKQKSLEYEYKYNDLVKKIKFKVGKMNETSKGS